MSRHLHILAMREIALMMPARDLLIPRFRDNPGVISALSERVKTGEYDELLNLAAHKGLMGIVLHLINVGIKKEIGDNNIGNTALHYATMRGNTEIVRLFLKTGWNKDVVNNLSSTPLHMAVRLKWSRNEIVEILLNAGADKNAQDTLGDTPLHEAATYNNIKAVRILLSKEVNTEIPNDNGEKAIDIAIKKGYTEIEALLS